MKKLILPIFAVLATHLNAQNIVCTGTSKEKKISFNLILDPFGTGQLTWKEPKGERSCPVVLHHHHDRRGGKVFSAKINFVPDFRKCALDDLPILSAHMIFWELNIRSETSATLVWSETQQPLDCKKFKASAEDLGSYFSKLQNFAR